jgi:molecular chaperone GrpE
MSNENNKENENIIENDEKISEAEAEAEAVENELDLLQNELNELKDKYARVMQILTISKKDWNVKNIQQ